ncbi:uncharacterized protein LOC132249893 [Alligator mississippiensis]|uniref:uncharacterized protein LOC132249893 n=1 Tax=Alligator mississippiensis TaxID=8496 RepID=UPI002878074B|nr:uncharacterized protein LOC132249893 [Alligator mississippiensis]
MEEVFCQTWVSLLWKLNGALSGHDGRLVKASCYINGRCEFKPHFGLVQKLLSVIPAVTRYLIIQIGESMAACPGREQGREDRPGQCGDARPTPGFPLGRVSKEPEEASDTSCSNSSREQTTSAGGEWEAAPPACEGISYRENSEGHTTVITTAGGSTGGRGEEEELYPLREPRQKQTEGPQRIKALTLSMGESQPLVREWRGTWIGMLRKGEKRGSSGLIEGEGRTQAGGQLPARP